MAEMDIECPQKISPGGICAEEEEFAEGETQNPGAEGEMQNPGAEGEMNIDRFEIDGTGGGAAAVGGYNKDRPPEDDCCPICFDEFRFPCRTSCGHWFCSGCILELWRYSTSVKPCKCPLCGCLIAKLVPDSSVLIQTGEEVGKMLNNIKQYNRLAGGGLAGLYLKALALPMLIRRRSREYLSPLMLRNIYSTTRLIGLLLGMLYDSYNFQFFPKGAMGINLLFEICGYSLVMLLILDAVWYHWMLRQRARRLAQHAHLE